MGWISLVNLTIQLKKKDINGKLKKKKKKKGAIINHKKKITSYPREGMKEKFVIDYVTKQWTEAFDHKELIEIVLISLQKAL